MSEQRGSTGNPGTPEGPPTYTPPAAGAQPPAAGDQPPAPAGELEPGRGAPLVTGPPRSVDDPINAGKINTVFGIGGVLGIVAIIIVVILVGLLLISLLSHH
jgi:hypothetical protein